MVTRCLRAGLGSKMYGPPALGGELERGNIIPSSGVHSDVFLGTCIGPGKQRAWKFCLLWLSYKEGKWKILREKGPYRAQNSL